MPFHLDNRLWILDSGKKSAIYNLKSKIWRPRRPGFTLIELLVVIALIGILASFAITSFNNAQQKGRDSRRKADLNAVKAALELARGDCVGGDWYPQGGTTTNEGIRYAGLLTYLRNTNLNYLKSLPLDPLNGDANYYYGYTTYTSGSGFLDASATVPGCPDTTGGKTRDGSLDYRLTARLENTSDPQIADSKAKCPWSSSFANLTDYTSVANVYVICND